MNEKKLAPKKAAEKPAEVKRAILNQVLTLAKASGGYSSVINRNSEEKAIKTIIDTAVVGATKNVKISIDKIESGHLGKRKRELLKKHKANILARVASLRKG